MYIILIPCVIVAVCRRDHKSARMYSHYPLTLLPSCPITLLCPFPLRHLKLFTCMIYIYISAHPGLPGYRAC